MSNGGGIIIIRSLKAPLPHTTNKKIKVWHACAIALLIGIAAGYLIF